jgi:peroxiredoxin
VPSTDEYRYYVIRRDVMSSTVEAPDWSRIPAPVDDGAARHLVGAGLPSVPLPSTAGEIVDLSRLPGRTVVYTYPRTGKPNVQNPEGWDLVPGARGCTLQSCAFRDHFAELKKLGVDHLYGLSTQDTPYQPEAAERLHLPFALLSDAAGTLTNAMKLPTIVVDRMALLKRLTLVLDDGRASHVFYPVFPPDQNASEVASWLGGNPPKQRGLLWKR